MYECLDLFSSPTKAWFRHAFSAPTDAQQEAWPHIKAGENVLVVAPTGSGKTLAAFLSAIDGLIVEQSAQRNESVAKAESCKTGGRPMPVDEPDEPDEPTHGLVAGSKVDKPRKAAKSNKAGKLGRNAKSGVKVLYISPLKALGADVERNLRVPLEGIAAECITQGVKPPDVDVAIRSGDTTAKERRRIATHPPDILITTPESLYLLLTSKARRILKGVETVIVDEVHALAATKRGAHLALSLERLDLLTGRKVQRIGLSATVNPPKEAAFFLGGDQPVTIVDATDPVHMDLKIVEPVADMGALGTASDDEGGFHVGGAGVGKGKSERNAEHHDSRHISGVSPAMRALAKAQKNPVDRNANIDDTPGNSNASTKHGDYSSPNVSASHSIWPAVERSILDEILSHHSTLVFVNSRGLAERLTARINDLYAETECGVDVDNRSYGDGKHYDSVVGSSTSLVGSHPKSETIAMAHHGSVSKERRKVIEDDLKHGRLRCVVATSSLELGIDMGAVDMVIQVAPPLSVSSGLQRVGRADHRVGGVSHALFYPLTRQELITSTATVESMRRSEIEPLAVRHNPLDILAQQTVATAAMDDLKTDDWYAAVRRTAPFATLSRDMFDNVIGMLTGAYNSEEFSAFRPPLQLNTEQGLISARPGAQRLAVTSGGTIPDRGTYTVVLPEADAGSGRKKVGELDEEMVYESRVGDVITLGTSTWQIDEITNDRVVVTPAPGRTARLPFWHGEGPGRDAGFGALLGSFVREIGNGLIPASSPVMDISQSDNDNDKPHFDTSASAVVDESNSPDDSANNRPSSAGVSSDVADLPDSAASKRIDSTNWSGNAEPHFDTTTEQRLCDNGLDDNGRANLARLLAEQKAATGALPTDKTIVIERCQDEEGDWRIILHSPYGRRVHEPWALAITNRLKRKYGFDGQTYATDDSIVVRLPEQDSHVSAAELFQFDADELLRDVEEEVGDSVLFATRFRECAARSLYMPRMNPGKRVPLWQQRLRASELLAAAKTQHNFPLVLETARECLQDVYDLPALKRLMTDIDDGNIEIKDVETQSPSPFAQNLLFGFVGSVMYEYDSPQAERRASLLAMDPEVLEELLGSEHIADALDPKAIKQVEDELSHRQFWNELEPDDVAGRMVRFAKTHGPFTADQAVKELGLDAATVVHELDDLKACGALMTGTFIKDLPSPQYLHREVFRRIRSRSQTLTRKSLKPVGSEVYQSWLLVRQGIGAKAGNAVFRHSSSKQGYWAGEENAEENEPIEEASEGSQVAWPRFVGTDGLLRVIEQLEGMPLPAAMWESSVFPVRVPDFTPSMLDELLSAGEVVWVGSKDGNTDSENPNLSLKPGKIAFYLSDSPLLARIGDPDSVSGHSDFEAAAQPMATGTDGRRDGNSQLAEIRYPKTSVADAQPGDHSIQPDLLTLEEGDSPDNGMMSLLSLGGSYRGEQLEARWRANGGQKPQEVVDPLTGEVRVSSLGDSGFERELWSLVWLGKVANSSFAPVRALLKNGNGARPASRSYARASMSRHRLYGRARVERRPQLPGTLAGLWSAVPKPQDVGPEQRAIAQVEVLLDRYGIIAPPLMDMDPGNLSFSDIYPVLKQMEATGTLVRGMFVRGLSAVQFAQRATIDQLRQWRTQDAPLAVALDAADPASLAGGAVAWPSMSALADAVEDDENSITPPDLKNSREPGHKRGKPVQPMRKVGSFVIFIEGKPILYAIPSSHHLLCFDATDFELQRAVTKLADTLRERYESGRRNGNKHGSVTFRDVNGEPLAALSYYAQLLRAAGFTPSPQGMKLYR
ncbi:DEAD/DEAH box helicase [Bifidobacterium sp. ESL0775]|uniref:DEAD/DEAH box helicase n=1 Tax=Bifidobacterium sp. ESL0775 TaxID=2983230 RepID=UPI0023F68FFB|nr:DEAD/DEAH box helicase [Bifidobacterium sp. ESL0775]WEV69868.1 DEAD/DEAH box helicase [Bifidobacterium sp. ESL0775]